MSARKISILGSTGSIGVQTLDVARKMGISVVALSANQNIDKMEAQVLEFRPRFCAMQEEQAALELSKRLKAQRVACDVLCGEEGVIACAEAEEADTCVASIVGVAGLVPTARAIQKGKQIALANKETLVTAGAYMVQLAKEHDVTLFPVDSEHSAIFQCLAGNRKEDVERILLTASGGPFRGKNRAELQHVTAKDALKHPTWTMGAKITIDSATLMNKGLEVIEASWLFDLPVSKIHPVVHPQSVIHSMVEYKDGAVLAQMGTPDMKLPIALALTWPERVETGFSKLDLLSCGALTFEQPDLDTFRCLALAFEAMEAGGTMPACMNGANEACVALFLQGRIGFLDIAKYIEEAMDAHVSQNHAIHSIQDVLDADAAARRFVMDRVGGMK